YQQLSNGYLTLTGTVLGWYTAPQTNTYYEDGCNGIGVRNSCPHGGLRMGELFLSALTAANAAGTDWGQFDNDGPDGVPNSGDDDGYVDFVAFIYALPCGGDARAGAIWPHRAAMPPFETKDLYRNGQRIKIADYVILP